MEMKTIPQTLQFLAGGGEMGALIREFAFFHLLSPL